MTEPRDFDPARLRFFATTPHECGYLPNRTARTVVADPQVARTPAVYSILARHGFRRSGDHVYAPYCESCQACISVRVDATRFTPRRIHRRVRRRNATLEVRWLRAAFAAEHFELYRRYMHARHGDGQMAQHDEEDYRAFLLSTWARTWLVEMRDGDRLVGVAVVDEMDDGWSCVYTFFAPEEAARSPGVLAILETIEHTRQHGQRWVYLGYWIAGCAKMAYKDQYFPQQRFVDGRWRDWDGPR